MAVAIRQFRDVDRAATVELWAEAFPDGPPHNVSADMIDRKVSVQGELFLVAMESGVLVGTVMAGYDGVRGWLHRLAVRDSARRAGVGTKLVREAEAALVRMGCPKVNVQVRAPNPSVVAFYRAAGYCVEERVSMARRLK